MRIAQIHVLPPFGSEEQQEDQLTDFEDQEMYAKRIGGIFATSLSVIN